MANPNIKFFRSANAPSNPQEGYIWFNSSNNTIQLYKNAAWEVYTGKINDVVYNENGTLVITKHDGTEISVPLGDVQNISDLSTRLSTLETNFNNLSSEFTTVKTTVNTTSTAVATIINQLKDIASEEKAVKTYVDTKMSNHETAREAIDADFTDRIGALETTTSIHTTEISDLKGLIGTTAVATQISNAINALDNGTNGVSDTGEKVTVTVKQEDGKVTSVTVSESDIASATTLNNLATTVNNNKSDLENKINIEKARINTLIGNDSGSIRDIAIDVLTETLVSENASAAYDELVEVSNWIKNHPGEAATMNNLLSQHTTAIATLNGTATTAGSVSKAVADVKTALEGTFKSGETSKTLAAINADVDALETRINNLDATVKDETDYIRGSITQANGLLTSVSFSANTGSVANNADALAIASDVKSYVDSMWTWAEY